MDGTSDALKVCWLCFRLKFVGDDGFRCRHCNRMFHAFCANKFCKVMCDGKKRCPQCLLIEEEEKRNIPREKVVAAQMNILSLIEFSLKNIESVVNGLKEEVIANQFITVEEFFIAVRELWINNALSNNSNSVFAKIAEMCRVEVEDFRLCFNCFEFRHDESVRDFWFICVCQKAHNLVYAKLGSHPFWPSKVIGYKKDVKTVIVRFFGTHELGFVSLKNCYRLSEHYPEKSEPKSEVYKRAKVELERHIRKIKCRFAGYNEYSNLHTPFNPKVMYISDEEGVTDYLRCDTVDTVDNAEMTEEKTKTNLVEETESCPSSSAEIGLNSSVSDSDESNEIDLMYDYVDVKEASKDPSFQPRVVLTRIPLLDALQHNKKIANVLEDAFKALKESISTQVVAEEHCEPKSGSV